MIDSFQGNGFIRVTGEWGINRVELTLVNVYAPCEGERKQQLWTDLIDVMQARGGELWCVMGDFNSVLSLEERKGAPGGTYAEDVECFQAFVKATSLIHLPLIGWRFTWYRPDGTSMSRLDHFLLSEGWVNAWPSLSQWALKRGLSDHCPIVMKEKVLN